MDVCAQNNLPVAKHCVASSGLLMVDLRSCMLSGRWRKSRWRKEKSMKHGSDFMTSGCLLVLSRILGPSVLFSEPVQAWPQCQWCLVTEWCLVCRWLYWMWVVLGQLHKLKLGLFALLLALTECKVMAIDIGKTFCRTRDSSYWILHSWQTLTRHGKLLSSTADFRYSCWVCVYVSFIFVGAVVSSKLHALSAIRRVTVECLQVLSTHVSCMVLIYIQLVWQGCMYSLVAIDHLHNLAEICCTCVLTCLLWCYWLVR